MVSTKKIIWTLSSLHDKIEIFEYWINKTKSDFYSKQLNHLFDKAANTLSMFPESGKSTSYRDVRIKIVGHYLIFYRIEEFEIQILRIWDSRNDPQKLTLKIE